MERIDPQGLELKEKVVHISRVAKVVKGGRRFSFSALVVTGDSHSVVGYGMGKAKEVPEAIRKGLEQAKKNLIRVPIMDGTIPFEVIGHYGAGHVILKPASGGTGVIAGGGVVIFILSYEERPRISRPSSLSAVLLPRSKPRRGKSTP